MERAQLTVVEVEYALTVEGKQVCSIRVMAAPPPIDSLPQPAARGPHTTREKSIYCDQRSLTTDLTSGLRSQAFLQLIRIFLVLIAMDRDGQISVVLNYI